MELLGEAMSYLGRQRQEATDHQAHLAQAVVVAVEVVEMVPMEMDQHHVGDSLTAMVCQLLFLTSSKLW